MGVGTGEKELLLLGTRDLLENEEVGYVVDRCVEEVFKQTSEQIRESFNTACQQRYYIPSTRVRLASRFIID